MLGSTKLSSLLSASYGSPTIQLGDQQARRNSTSEILGNKEEIDITKRPSSLVSKPFSFSPSPVASPITVSSAANDDYEERLQHLDAMNKIRSKRDSARLKYQRILINRSSAVSKSTADTKTITAATSTASAPSSVNTSVNADIKKKKRSKLKKPKMIQRDCSEIDDRDENDDDTVLETDTVCSPRMEDDFFGPRPSTVVSAPLPIGSSNNNTRGAPIR